MTNAAASAPFEVHAKDTVDSLPTHMYYIWRHDLPAASNLTPKLRKLTQAAISERIEPYVRHRYNCPECRACSSIVRRYRSGDRVRIPPHFDFESFVTVVVALTAQRQVETESPSLSSLSAAREANFSGGLYIRAEPGTERWVPEQQLGDAIAHQFDVEHGVTVESGERLSWIVWLQDSAQCGVGAQTRWHEAAARRGDALAQYHLGSAMARAAAHNSTAAAAGLQWVRRSAEQGYGKAMLTLANSHATGTKGARKDYAEAWRWYEQAAVRGYSGALVNGASMLLRRRNAGDVAEAVEMLERAVTDPFANTLPPASLLLQIYNSKDATLAAEAGLGDMAPAEREARVLELWRMAAAQGSQAAQRELTVRGIKLAARAGAMRDEL